MRILVYRHMLYIAKKNLKMVAKQRQLVVRA